MDSMDLRLDLAIRGAAVVRGSVPAEFDQVRADQRTNGYFYLLDRACDWALPFGTRGLSSQALAHLAPPRPTAIDVSPPGTSAGDMAVQAARLALAQDEAPGEVRWLIYCPTALDEDTGSSIACRLSHELQLPQCFPVAISQAQAAGTGVALALAASVLAAAPPGDRVLLVAADKWMFPFLRSHGARGVLSDGAAALLLGGPRADAGLRLAAASVRSAPESMWAPPDSLQPPEADPAHARRLAERAWGAGGGLPDDLPATAPPAAASDRGAGPVLARLVEEIRRLQDTAPAPGAALVVLEGVHGDAGAFSVSLRPAGCPVAEPSPTARAAELATEAP